MARRPIVLTAATLALGVLVAVVLWWPDAGVREWVTVYATFLGLTTLQWL